MKSVWASLAAALAIAAPAQPQTATREGNYWIATRSGAVQAGPRLKIVTRGAVTLRGENRPEVAYTVRERVRSANARDARELIAKIGLKAVYDKGWTVVFVQLPANVDGAADVEVRAPKQLKEAVIDSQLGSIEAYDIDGSLLAKTAAGQIRIDRIHGMARVGTGGGDVHIGRVDGPIKAFSGGGSITASSLGGNAYLETAGGEIAVSEAMGNVQASAGTGGNIRIQRAAGDAVLSTGGGVIDAARVKGLVRAKTDTGSIKVRSADSVDLTSGTGQIRIQEVRGIMQATTVMGCIVAELPAGKLMQDSLLSTQSGDITVYIPSNFAMTVDAMNTSPGGHRIFSEFPEIKTQLAGGNMRSQAQGSLNGGGATLRLAAQGGTIFLRRRR